MKRPLILLAYDIGQPKLQARIRKRIREEASSYQLSAYECYLTGQEQKDLLAELTPQIPDEASLIACRLDNTRPSYYLGQAQPPADSESLLIDSQC